MEIQDLQFFAEVARTQSFTRAATRLHVGQPAVSQRIASLEKNLGNSLFERHRHGVRLTGAGRVFLTYVERILALIGESEIAISSVPTNHLNLRMAGPATINSYLLPTLISQLDHNGHDVSLRDAHSHEVMQQVLDGTIDVGFVIDTPNQPGIHNQLLKQDPIICVASKMHPLSGGISSILDLQSYSIAFYRFSYEYDSMVGYLTRSINSGFTNTLQIAPVESVKGMLRTDKYISFVPKMTVQRELLSGEFVQIQVADLPVYTWNISMIYRERKQLSGAVSAILNSYFLLN